MAEFKSAPTQESKKTIAAPKQEAKSEVSELEYSDNRSSTAQLVSLQSAADGKGNRSNTTQLQAKASVLTGASRVAQLKAASDVHQPEPTSATVQRQENKTGLPDKLKSGMESLSGLSMSDVKVHRNSDKPAQLQAHAYAQGTDIHLGPGQEKHLPHELGHVVQQKQGRVKPTMQLKGKVNVNDNAGLEKEADVFGRKALNLGFTDAAPAQLISSTSSPEVTQLAPKWLKNLFGRGEKYKPLLDEGTESDSPAPEAAATEEAEGVLIETEAFSYQDGVITMELWPGQQISFGKGAVSGTLPSKAFEMEIGSFEASVDIPFAPGAYATVSLGITPSLSVSISGGTFEIGNKSLSIDGASITGTMGLDVTAKAGAGVGVANVVGIEAGAFASLGGEASLGGTMAGSVNFDTNKNDVTMALNSNADIVGKAGLFVQAKALGYSVSKKWILANKKFAHFSYTRGIALTGERGNWMPRISDFRKVEFGDYSSQNFLETEDGNIYSNDPDYDIRTPLLGAGSRSDG
jgi:hypothetical protein